MRLPRIFRHLRLDPLRFDQAFAVLLLAAAELEVWLTHDAGRYQLEAALIAPGLAAAVAVRRLYPLWAGVGAQAIIAFVFAVWGNTQIFGTSIAWFCALYALTVWTSSRGFAYGTVFVLASNLAAAAGPYGTLKRSTPFAVVTLVVMLLVRRVVGDRERRAQLAERERDLAAREAVIEERARIARELHDAIAHNVSMMVVQAGAERRQLDEAGGATRDVLATIEQVGRGALTEMRRLVGMLRSDTADPLTPQPGLADLPLLVAQVCEAGLPVELQVEGERRALPRRDRAVGVPDRPGGVDECAEACGRGTRHRRRPLRAGVARARDRRRRRGRRDRVAGGGHGLVGMRERVALYGGRLDAGRRLSGGFAVRVLLPIR